MSRISKIVIAVLLIAVALAAWWKWPQAPEPAASKEPTGPSAALAAPGRVEGREETISVGSSTEGVIKAVLVKDGQVVSKGALLAVINCDEINAEIDLARAQADSARQARTRLLRGHREEERSAAAKEADAAKAVSTQAQEHFTRFDALYQKGEISRDAFEQTKRDLDVAQANYERALDELKLVSAEPLPEEIARADAEVAAADRNVSIESARLEKCNVRAPISGTVLKVMTKVGEPYSVLVPHPILTLADESVRRVRAEVDERDISKVRLGQSSIVTADGYPGQSFNGRVVEISKSMKSKTVLSEDPTQKADRDVLDVIIELDHPQQQLPVGLRVTALMTTGTSGGISSSASGASSSDPRQLDGKPEGNRTKPDATTPKGFVLQVAALAQKKNMEALVAALEEKKFATFVSTRKGDSLFRVNVGPYPDAKHALAAADGLKAAGFGTATKRLYVESDAASIHASRSPAP